MRCGLVCVLLEEEEKLEILHLQPGVLEFDCAYTCCGALYILTSFMFDTIRGVLNAYPHSALCSIDSDWKLKLAQDTGFHSPR